MKVKDLQLYKENNKYYLSAIFEYEDKKGYYEMSIPKIEFPASRCQMNYEHNYDLWYGPRDIAKVDFGFCELNVIPVEDKDTLFTINCIEEKVHEMTLDEIEKALGHKIKLKEN